MIAVLAAFCIGLLVFPGALILLYLLAMKWFLK